MHVRMKKLAMFQQNYMIVLKMADKLDVIISIIVSPAKQKRDICTAFPAAASSASAA